MSGAFFSPHALTGGAGYKANPTYDQVLRKHSAFYRRHSAASNALEEDRRRSSAGFDIAEHVAEANRNVNAGADAQDDGFKVEGTTSGDGAAGGAARRGSVLNATAGGATANERKGSIVVGSTAGRRESVFGMESTKGHIDVEGPAGERRMSTSLAQDLLGKLKERRGSHAQ